MSGGCYPNGTLTLPPQRRRLVDEVKLQSGAGVLTLDYTVLYEMVMEQWIAHISAVPGTSEEIKLIKKSKVSAEYDTLLRAVNFADEQVQDLACVIPFRFKAGDHVLITFPNSDSLIIGTEFYGIELIP